jgi:hypothetical protein
MKGLDDRDDGQHRADRQTELSITGPGRLVLAPQIFV